MTARTPRAAPEATTGAPADTTAAPAASTTAAPESSTTAGGEAGASVDGVLTYGTILPVTGSLAFLGPPEIAGARLAIEDINAAGGVLGADVVLVEGDSGDDTQDIVNPEVDRLLAQGADAIFGAASSAVTKLVIDKIVGANVIQFSPANTSPDFTTYDDNGLYFRTAPSDLLQGRVLADLIAGEGAQTLGILYRQEAYGEGLANAIRENFEGLGGTVEPFIAYDTSAETFDAEVDQLVQADPDAIVVVGFVESAVILTTMNERGIGPVDKAVWGVDGNIGGIGAELQDPSIISGFRGTAPSVDLATITDFTDRLDDAYPPDGVRRHLRLCGRDVRRHGHHGPGGGARRHGRPGPGGRPNQRRHQGRHQVHHVRGVPAAGRRRRGHRLRRPRWPVRVRGCGRALCGQLPRLHLRR